MLGQRMGRGLDDGMGDACVEAKQDFHERLQGIMVNAVPDDMLGDLQGCLTCMEDQGVPVLGAIPQRVVTPAAIHRRIPQSFLQQLPAAFVVSKPPKASTFTSWLAEVVVWLIRAP